MTSTIPPTTRLRNRNERQNPTPSPQIPGTKLHRLIQYPVEKDRSGKEYVAELTFNFRTLSLHLRGSKYLLRRRRRRKIRKRNTTRKIQVQLLIRHVIRIDRRSHRRRRGRICVFHVHIHGVHFQLHSRRGISKLLCRVVFETCIPTAGE